MKLETVYAVIDCKGALIKICKHQISATSYAAKHNSFECPLFVKAVKVE